MTPHLLDDPIDGREAKTRAKAQALGREERLESMIERALVHAGARIRDLEPNVATRLEALYSLDEGVADQDVGCGDRQ